MALSGLSHTHITPVTVRAHYRMSHEVRCRMRVVEVSRSVVEMCLTLVPASTDRTFSYAHIHT